MILKVFSNLNDSMILQGCLGLLWRRRNSQVATPDSSKEAPRGILSTLEAGPCLVAARYSSQAAPGAFWFPLQTDEVPGSSPRLFWSSYPKSIVYVGGRSMPGSSSAPLAGSSAMFWPPLETMEFHREQPQTPPGDPPEELYQCWRQVHALYLAGTGAEIWTR